MSDGEAWATVCHPLPSHAYPAYRRRAIFARAFVILCALSVLGGALYGLAH